MNSSAIIFCSLWTENLFSNLCTIAFLNGRTFSIRITNSRLNSSSSFSVIKKDFFVCQASILIIYGISFSSAPSVLINPVKVDLYCSDEFFWYSSVRVIACCAILFCKPDCVSIMAEAFSFVFWTSLCSKFFCRRIACDGWLEQPAFYNSIKVNNCQHKTTDILWKTSNL